MLKIGLDRKDAIIVIQCNSTLSTGSYPLKYNILRFQVSSELSAHFTNCAQRLNYFALIHTVKILCIVNDNH